jgi:hypothetical protein
MSSLLTVEASPQAAGEAPAPRRTRAWLSLPLAAGVTQLATAAAVLLVVGLGAGRQTDAYFLMLSAGQLVTAVWVIGFDYPRRLARRDGTRLGRSSVVAAIGAAVTTALGGAYALAVGYPPSRVFLVFVPVALSTAGLAAATTFAAGFACRGRGGYLATAPLPSGLGATAAWLLVRPSTPGETVLVVAIAAAVCNAGWTWRLAVLWRRAPRMAHGDTPAKSARDAGWLLVAGSLGAFSPIAFQAVLAPLPSGDLTRFTVASKAAMVLTSVATGAVLPLLVNWSRYADTALRRMVSVCVVLMPVAAMAGQLVARHAPHWVDASTVARLAALVAAAPATTIVTQALVGTGRLRDFKPVAIANAVTTVGFLVLVAHQQSLATAAAGLLAVHCAVLVVMVHRLRWDGLAVSCVIAGVAGVATTIPHESTLTSVAGTIVASGLVLGILARHSSRPVTVPR